MKILMTNHDLTKLGGSETWTRTMYDELSKGHEVNVYTPRPNTLYPDMAKWAPGITYDLVLANHNTPFRTAMKVMSGQYKIFTSHGVIPRLEQPIPGADAYVAVSEEVRDTHPAFDMHVIRNPINTEVFHPRRDPSQRLKRVLFISNNQVKSVNVVREACRGLRLHVLGRGERTHNVQEAMNWADLVISLGRGCYEAMACGRNVIVFDDHGGDGFVTTESIQEYRLNNCSGRRHRIRYTPQQLRLEMAKYDPTLGEGLRQYAIDNHGVGKIASQYLALM